jgi:hypothetical protein
MARLDPARGEQIIRRLLEGHEEDDIATANTHLRPLLVAIRAASDLRKLSPSVASKLAEAAWYRLIDETSLWVGERVARVAEDWTRAAGPGSRFIVAWAFDVLRRPPQPPAQWHAAQTYEQPDELEALLYHRDANVRAVATEKLAPWADDANIHTSLLYALQDQGYGMEEPPVAMAAGRVVRRIKRDSEFEPTRELLLLMLHNGWQFHRAGAALALLPTEADLQRIVAGLAEGARGAGAHTLPKEVLLEIAATDKGRELLDGHIPGWDRSEPSGWIRLKSQVPASEFPPSTFAVRGRLLRTIMPVLHQASPALLAELQRADQGAVFEAASLLAESRPMLLVSVVKNVGDRFLSLVHDHAALALGRAAMRHEPVRQALFELWNKSGDSPQRLININRSEFPGRALEGLIQRGDREALRTYAEWLKYTYHAPLLSSFVSPLFDHARAPAEIQSAGHSIAEEIWLYATIGRTDEQGKVTMLYSRAAGAALYRLSSFWGADPRLRSQVEQWLERDEFEYFSAGLWALQRAPLSTQKRRLIAGRARDLWLKEEGELHALFRWWELLHLIERASLTQDVLPVLDALTHTESSLALLATALLLPFRTPEERRELSANAAKAPDLIQPIAPHLAERLVSAAPDVWSRKLRAMFKGTIFSSGSLWIPFVRALPVKMQRSVARTWANAASERPWVHDDGSLHQCVRPGDRARELLFDFGLGDSSGLAGREGDAAGDERRADV